MAEFFDPGTAAGMIKTITDINSQWSEGVPPDVMAEYAKIGVSVYNNGKTVTINYASPDGLIKQLNAPADSFPNTSAAQALEAYKAAGGKVSYNGTSAVASNKISSGGKVITYETAGTAGAAKLSVGGILSMNLPTAAAAIAPIAGVALGAGLYSLNPELWTKISKALLPFCYEDTELLPVVYDESGSTYFPKEAVDAVSSVLTESVQDGAGIPGSSISEHVSPVPFKFYTGISNCAISFSEDGTKWDVVCSITSGDVRAVPYVDPIYDSAYGYVFASKSPFSGTYKDPWNRGDFSGNFKDGPDGTGFYWVDIRKYEDTRTFSSFSLGDHVTIIGDQGSVGPIVEIATAMIYGVSEEYPVGVSRWNGVQYPSSPGVINVVTKISEDGGVLSKSPYLPVTTPTGVPGVSVDSTASNLTTNPDPNAAIDPWLVQNPSASTYPPGVAQSTPSPIPDDVPNFDPSLDPNNNPSEYPQQRPQEQPSLQDPTSSGTTTSPQNPSSPAISAATGLIHVYNPTIEAVERFGQWLWTTFSGDIIDTVSKLFNNPMDAVIGLHELYVKPNIAGTNTIKAGYLDSRISSEIVGNRYSSLNCGSVVVPEWYQNYLDYSPYTKCFAYLPFIGIVPLSADDIIGSAVNITYHIDSYTGCCIAIVTTAREGYSATTYQFEGNCAVEIPITSGYQSTLMGAMLGIAGTAVTGNPHVGLAASNLGRATLGKNEVSHSGSFGASYGAMGLKSPYIIVKRPTQKIAPNYNILYGLPAHKIVTIGACTGYLRVREVHVQSPTATDDEKARIEELLKEGVIVT